MVGIAFEGGGAKGAYHIGVMSAIKELGIKYDAIVGTSIGAINGAICTQGDLAKAIEFWQNITGEDIFLPQTVAVLTELTTKFKISNLAEYRGFIQRVIKNKGIDVSHIKAFIDRLVDVDKLMNSPVDFGLATVEIPEFKVVKLFKGQMPSVEIKDYIMASASFPGFHPTVVEHMTFIDGGLRDNCPVDMLFDKGFSTVIAVRTLEPNTTQALQLPEKKQVIKVIEIRPSESLGATMVFTKVTSQHNLDLGYRDAMKVLTNLEEKI